nr:EGF region [Hymenolepis microstoma]
MDSKKQHRKSRSRRSREEGRQQYTIESLFSSPPSSSFVHSFRGILTTTEGQSTNPRGISPVQICPPPPGPIPYHGFTSAAVTCSHSHSQQKPDYNISLLGVQMSLQVLNPLPSPLRSPLLSPRSNNNTQSQHQYSLQFECRCSSTESDSSVEPSQLSSAYESPKCITTATHRPETTYFPISMAASRGNDKLRRVRFRPPPLPAITTTVTSVSEVKSSHEGETTKVDSAAPNEGQSAEDKKKEKSKKENEPVESLEFPDMNEAITTTNANTTSKILTTTANHLTSRFNFPNHRKTPPPMGIRVDPSDCPTDVTVATATVNVVPTPENLLANVTRKMNTLQRQNTIEEKSYGSKAAQERHGRLSLRPSLHVFSAIRGSLKSVDDGSAPVSPLPNGVIKSSTIDSPNVRYSSSQPPTRRMARFSSLLRASGDVSAETETADILGGGDQNIFVNEFLPDHRAVLMEFLCCCCHSNQCCDRNGAYTGRTNESYSTNSGRSRRESGGRGDNNSSERRRGDYSNLIENHRLARLVTFLSILAILILVFWYIGKLILEQQSGLKTNSSSSSSSISISSFDWVDD